MSLIFCLFSFFANEASASWWEALKKNNQGVENFEKEQYPDANKNFIEALSEDPFASEVHVNLGLTFEKNKEVEKALSEYLVAKDSAVSAETRFYALFNAARILGELQKYAPALQLYQSALDLRPDSLEVKTNIELLIQQAQQQQQQGGGGSKDKDKKEDKKPDEKDEQKRDGERVNRREKEPKPFNSEQLTKQDVDRILEEIKNQEQKVRLQQNQKSTKETPREKDW